MAKLQNNNHIRYFSSKQISTPQKERGHKALTQTPFKPPLHLLSLNSPVRHTKAPKTPLKRPQNTPRPPPM
nr:MAG TPA: hypothetical protein [Caudoviricetes sp.]